MKYKKGNITQLSKNFKSTEFDCKCKGLCKETTVDEKLVDILQKIRDNFQKPVTINSGYRCSAHNKNVGGASSSRHLTGSAADIVVRDTAPIEVARYAESIGVLGIGLYDWGCHIDTRTSKSFWKTADIIKVDTFMEKKPVVEKVVTYDYYVSVGPFSSKEDAVATKDALIKGGNTAVVVTIEK